MNRQAWRDFFITVFFLGVAFLVALLSSVAADQRNTQLATIAAAVSLIMALLGALYIIPRLARNVRLEILRFAIRTTVTLEGLLFIVFMVITPMIARGVAFELPITAHHDKKNDDNKDLIVSVTAGGDITNKALEAVKDGGRVAYPNGVEPIPKVRAEVKAIAYDGEPDTRAINKLNKGKSLPYLKITVIHRSDNSGTTYNLTDYLSRVSPSWKSAQGRGVSVNWPTGIGEF